MDKPMDINRKVAKAVLDMTVAIDKISEQLASLTADVAGLKLDHQSHISANTPIAPSSATKVSYDANGLIVGSQDLTESDIPKLSIDKIEGLRDRLEKLSNTSSASELTRPTRTVQNITKSNTTDTYDMNILNKMKIIEESVENIRSETNSLTNLYNQMSSSLQNILDQLSSIHPKNITPGSGSKIFYNSQGHIVESRNLGMEDLPVEISQKFDKIALSLGSIPTKKWIDEFVVDPLKRKADATNIDAGIYTKLVVNSNGLVMSGSKLDKSDLPELSIDDIKDLSKKLRDTVTTTAFMDLSDKVSSLTNSTQKVGEIDGIKKELDLKASDATMKNLSNQVTSLDTLVKRLISGGSVDGLSSQLNNIQSELTSISGRIAQLELKMSRSSSTSIGDPSVVTVDMSKFYQS